MKQDVFCIIMGGGRGSRLRPLTTLRAKPAVPLAGKYRLVDIPISNCLNSGLNRISVLTQFNTASLHHHIQDTYRFDPFRGGYVEILSAEQTVEHSNWYEGTADAVRKNLQHFDAEDEDLFLILSGDQLYRMDLQQILADHRRTGARVTIAAKPVGASDVEGLGVLQVDDDLRVTRFAEKPTDAEEIASLTISDPVRSRLREPCDGAMCLVNMGIYVFDRRTLWAALSDERFRDFSKEVIPRLLDHELTRACLYEGYWRDIGTVRAFFEANLDMANADPPFDLFEQEFVVFTHPRFLPASRLHRCTIERAIVADGCQIVDAELTRCVVGVRSRIGAGTALRSVVMMGQDRFETERALRRAREAGLPPIGIGRDCVIQEAIIDKNARIGDGVRLSPVGLPDGFNQGDVVVRDGVLVVMKNGVVPAGTIVGG